MNPAEYREWASRVESLPPGALVAWALRCVERVLPVHDAFDDDPETRSILQQLVRLMRDRTADAGSERGPREQGDALIARYRAMVPSIDLAWRIGGDVRRMSDVHRYAAKAAIEAWSLFENAGRRARDRAMSAMLVLGNALESAGECRDAAKAAMMRDLDELVSSAKDRGWVESTRVRPSFFGEMWPQGAPAGWPRP